MQIFNNLRVFR